VYQQVKYTPGQQFKVHQDGQYRKYTILLYLNDLDESEGDEHGKIMDTIVGESSEEDKERLATAKKSNTIESAAEESNGEEEGDEGDEGESEEETEGDEAVLGRTVTRLAASQPGCTCFPNLDLAVSPRCGTHRYTHTHTHPRT
jgi:hypothetical protein